MGDDAQISEVVTLLYRLQRSNRERFEATLGALRRVVQTEEIEALAFAMLHAAFLSDPQRLPISLPQ